MRKYVAMLDILGFRDLILSNDNDVILRIINNILKVNIEFGVSFDKFKIVERAGKQIAIPDVSQAALNVIVLSDTIILHSNNDSIKSFIDICLAVKILLTSGFYSGIPLRGAIVYV